MNLLHAFGSKLPPPLCKYASLEHSTSSTKTLHRLSGGVWQTCTPAKTSWCSCCSQSESLHTAGLRGVNLLLLLWKTQVDWGFLYFPCMPLNYSSAYWCGGVSAVQIWPTQFLNLWAVLHLHVIMAEKPSSVRRCSGVVSLWNTLVFVVNNSLWIWAYMLKCSVVV